MYEHSPSSHLSASSHLDAFLSTCLQAEEEESDDDEEEVATSKGFHAKEDAEEEESDDAEEGAGDAASDDDEEEESDDEDESEDGDDIVSQKLKVLRTMANSPKKRSKFSNFCKNTLKVSDEDVVEKIWAGYQKEQKSKK